MGLKNIFSQNKPSELKETIKMNQEKEIEEEEEETEIVEAVGKGDKFNLSASSKIRNNSRPKAFKASRSKKEMVWFK